MRLVVSPRSLEDGKRKWKRGLTVETNLGDANDSYEEEMTPTEAMPSEKPKSLQRGSSSRSLVFDSESNLASLISRIERDIELLDPDCDINVRRRALHSLATNLEGVDDDEMTMVFHATRRQCVRKIMSFVADSSNDVFVEQCALACLVNLSGFVHGPSLCFEHGAFEYLMSSLHSKNQSVVFYGVAGLCNCVRDADCARILNNDAMGLAKLNDLRINGDPAMAKYARIIHQTLKKSKCTTNSQRFPSFLAQKRMKTSTICIFILTTSLGALTFLRLINI